MKRSALAAVMIAALTLPALAQTGTSTSQRAPVAPSAGPVATTPPATTPPAAEARPARTPTP
ncbi:MAG: hypothetical protein JWO26_408, partial [Rhodospirillales bacterium]|nr:hypothetical protein [Rhodospirillales bacterium]